MGWQAVVLGLYIGLLALMCIYGTHRLWMLWHAQRLAQREVTPPVDAWPMVTVQLPLFNERHVVERLLKSVAELDYPKDRLLIQVLDDSTDDTTDRVQAGVEQLREQGFRAEMLHRENRQGFKAGALEEGLGKAEGDYIAVFDADFLPTPDFLRRTVPWLLEGYGMVQARWGHVNLAHSWLTQAQGTLLDGHFVVEHAARHYSGRWFNFNGTAGIWCRQAIEDAGGWSHDTLTEDLDLSYRSQMAGWKFKYLRDLVQPAELPDTVSAFKSQQHRWAKGSVQTALKLMGPIWRSSAPVSCKLEASFHLTSNSGYPVMLGVTFLLPMAVFIRGQGGWDWSLGIDLILFGLATVSVFVFYGASVVLSGFPQVGGRLLRLPLVLALGIGMGVAQTRAVFDGLFGPVGVFVRTPKSGESSKSSYRSRVHPLVYVELVFAVYLSAAFLYAVVSGYYASLPFLALFAGGFILVGTQSLREAMAKG